MQSFEHIPLFPPFAENGTPPHKAPRLSEEALALATARFPIPCTDIVLVDENGCMVLANRRHPAAMGWWWMGGALSTGVTPEENLTRILTREIGFVPDRIRRVGIFLHAWATCRERPGERRDDIIFLHAACVGEDAIRRINLDPSEYHAEHGLMRFNGTQDGLRPVLYAAHEQLRVMGMTA